MLLRGMLRSNGRRRDEEEWRSGAIVDKVENKLKILCSLSSKLWNDVSYASRRSFSRREGWTYRIKSSARSTRC